MKAVGNYSARLYTHTVCFIRHWNGALCMAGVCESVSDLHVQWECPFVCCVCQPHNTCSHHMTCVLIHIWAALARITCHCGVYCIHTYMERCSAENIQCHVLSMYNYVYATALYNLHHYYTYTHMVLGLYYVYMNLCLHVSI